MEEYYENSQATDYAFEVMFYLLVTGNNAGQDY
jgi:hypothetical protein